MDSNILRTNLGPQFAAACRHADPTPEIREIGAALEADDIENARRLSQATDSTTILEIKEQKRRGSVSTRSSRV